LYDREKEKGESVGLDEAERENTGSNWLIEGFAVRGRSKERGVGAVRKGQGR